MNARECLVNVENLIKELEDANRAGYASMDYDRMGWKGYSSKKVFKIRAICDECNIFDWWNETLSMSQLKQMRTFLNQAIKLGFTGYVCFKVGAAGCSHGMWAHKEESIDGYSPDGDVLFHSFRSGDNYFDMELNGIWMHEKYATKENPCPDFTLKQIKEELKNN
jgi:hypothetical protein